MKTLKLASIISLLAISSSYAGDSAPLSGAGSPAQHNLAKHSAKAVLSEDGSAGIAVRSSEESSGIESVLENSADDEGQSLLTNQGEQPKKGFLEKATFFFQSAKTNWNEHIKPFLQDIAPKIKAWWPKSLIHKAFVKWGWIKEPAAAAAI